jgi:hypothetical protein
MPVECGQELLIGSGHGELLMHYNAERRGSVAGPAKLTLNPGYQHAGPVNCIRSFGPTILNIIVGSICLAGT